MTKLKVATASVALLFFIAVIGLQHRERNRLAAQVVSLQEQAAQASSLREEGERLIKLSHGTDEELSQDQLRELLRLRGEVGVLRAQLAEATNLVQKLVSKDRGQDSPEERERRKRSTISALLERATEQQKKLDDAKRRVEQLLVTLKVPDEVLGMDASAALDSVSLKQYRPYFEAQRDREEMERFMQVLKLKMLSEKLESEAHAPKGSSE